MSMLKIPSDPDKAHSYLLNKISCLHEKIEDVVEVNRKQDERLEKIEHNTDSLVEIFRNCKGAFKVFNSIGKLLIWIASLSSALYAIYYAIVNWPHRS